MIYLVIMLTDLIWLLSRHTSIAEVPSYYLKKTGKSELKYFSLSLSSSDLIDLLSKARYDTRLLSPSSRNTLKKIFGSGCNLTRLEISLAVPQE